MVSSLASHMSPVNQVSAADQVAAATSAPNPTVAADVRLAAQNSVAHVPENIAQTIANIPSVEYEAINKTSDAFENSGNWWLYIPTNVVGFDQQDKEKLEGLTLLMVPIPLVAQANYDQWWLSLAANAPMTPNCTGIPGPCSDVFYFDQYGTVPTWQLVLGYTFPEIRNTIDPDHDTYTTPEGKVVHIQPDWSGKTYKLDPWGPQRAIWETLTQKPTGYRAAPTIDQWAKSFQRLGNAMWIGLNPNVEGTYCLPCQLGGTVGAPDSLPKQYLFGNYYTFFDFGQPHTRHDWVYNRPDYDETKREDWVEVRNGWDPKVQQELIADARAATTPQALRDSTDEFFRTMDAIGKELDKNIAVNIEGLQKAFGVTLQSGQQLLDDIGDSFSPRGTRAAEPAAVASKNPGPAAPTHTAAASHVASPSTGSSTERTVANTPAVVTPSTSAASAPTPAADPVGSQIAQFEKAARDFLAPLTGTPTAAPSPGAHAAVADVTSVGKHRASGGAHRAAS